MRGLLGGFKGGQIGGSVQALQLGLPSGVQLGQLDGGAFVAAGQRHPQAQAGIKVGQALGIEVGAAQPGLHAVRHILGLRQSRGQLIGQRLEFGFDAGLVEQGVLRLHQAQGGTAAVVLQTVQSGLGGVHQRLGIGQAAVLGVEFFPFVGLR